MKLRKHRRPGNRPQTKAEAAHVTAVKLSPCVACEQLDDFKREGQGPWPMSEAHHLLSGGVRIGHMATVPLCQWHHRARLIVTGWDHVDHRINLGPSLEEGSGPFHRRFGSDAELAALAAQLLRTLPKRVPMR